MSARVSNYNPSVPAMIKQVVDRVRTAKLSELQEYDETINTITYLYGNIKEIAGRLLEMGANSTQKKNKFPCFMLLLDIPIERADNRSELFGTATANIIIANHTKQVYTSEQREAKNFDPILRPLYREFLYQLYQQTGFQIQSERRVKHRMTERFYWGIDDATKTALGDYTDAIEISNLELKINWQWCQDIINNNI